MDEKSIKPVEWRKTPIVDEDLMILLDYFRNRRACLFDEIGTMEGHILSKELILMDKYIGHVKNVNKKLLLS